MSNFNACLKVVLANEGGFVDDPHDPGGATNLGVTQDTWSAWIGTPATIAEIEALTPAKVTPLYDDEYWRPAGCEDWFEGVDLVVFDFAVNAGVSRSVRMLQAAVGVTADGIIGPDTKSAVHSADVEELIHEFSARRAAYYRSLATFPRYGKGWLARTDRVEQAALEMANG